MAGGLFKTAFTKDGIFEGGLFSRYGTSPPVKRMDIRLGEAEMGPAGPGFFGRSTAGFPNWLLGVFIFGLGLAYYRRKRKAKNKSSSQQ